MRRRIVYPALFTAAGLMIAWLEFLIIPPTPMPGVKLGLANIATLAALYTLGAGQALCVCAARVFLSAFLFGSLSSAMYALSGGLTALLVMIVLKRTGVFSIAGVSAAGGCFHNAGQLALAALVARTPGLMYYAPVLLIAGTATGLITSLAARPVIKTLSRLRM